VTRVPTAHVDASAPHEDGEPALGERPLTLVDIARVLGGSAGVGRSGDGIAIRAWRDDLTLLDEALTYARSVLAADLAVLSHPPLGAGDAQALVDQLPGVLVGNPAGDRATEAGADELEALDFDLDLDLDLNFAESLFMRTDHLLAPHHQMATVDLSVPAARARVRALVEEQIAILTERQAAVQARLQQIRAVIIRQYRDSLAPREDQTA
jgi:hypothetical protein